MNLFVSNLNPQTTEESLRTLFAEFGEIVSVKIPMDAETGLPRGFGFVEMADKFESYDAIDNIDGIYFEGQVIAVKESKPKNAQQNNRGGGRFNNNRGGGGFNRGGGGGYRSNDGGGGYRSNDRSGGGGYRSNDGGGYRSNDRSSGGYRSNDGDGGYRKSNYGNSSYGNSNDNRGNSDDPNRQPGRRFSPRGPRPGNDN